MNAESLPWLELSVLFPLLGVPWVALSRSSPESAARRCLAVTAVTLACAVAAWLTFYLGLTREADGWGFGRLLTLDELSAPLLPLVALLHFLVVLATARTKMARFSFTWLLAGESLRLATFACKQPWPLIVLLIAAAVPPYLELRQRGRPTRVYVVYTALFAVLLVAGWICVEASPPGAAPWWATASLLLAVLVRSGTVPAHPWLTDLFERASFGTALLVAAPITGVYAAVRLVLPIAPGWVLQSLGVASLLTAVYAACLAAVQREARRFFAYLFLSHASLVLVGLELVTPISLTGALALWFSVTLSLAGLGLTLRALEARFGRLALTGYRGLYDTSPALAVCFLLTGLASVGFPGTPGFVSAELLVDGAVEANLWVGLGVIVAAAINGIAVVRAYLLLFTGARHSPSVPLGISLRERLAVLTLAALILGGGLYPQPGIASRHAAAKEILAERTGVSRAAGGDDLLGTNQRAAAYAAAAGETSSSHWRAAAPARAVPNR
jgi:NADH-quinone oxidoreductase subunit M